MTNVVGNPGFETALIDTDVIPQPITYGNWIAHQSYGSIYRPTRVPSPHDGAFACRIQATVGTGSGGWVLQDFPASVVTAGTGFYLSAFVKPVSGDESIALAFDYDRGPGTTAGYVGVNLWADHSDFAALGASAPAAPPVPFDGAWHRVAFRGFPDLTTRLEIDDAVAATLVGVSLPTFSTASIIIGEGTGLSHPRVDDFYWDDVSLDFSPAPSEGWRIGVVE